MKNEKNTEEQNSREKAERVVGILKELYPDAICSLEWNGEPWKLLIMGRLSAQCTDAKVNVVCRELFREFPTARAVADAQVTDIERVIRPCGLYRTKAQNLKDECKMLCDDYGGNVPDTAEELLKFPGVGRKIANLVLGDVYHKPGIVADTHCIRINGRLGFYPEQNKDPYKTEVVMSGLIAPAEQSDYCHRMVLFGRDICRARMPLCEVCPLAQECCHKNET